MPSVIAVVGAIISSTAIAWTTVAMAVLEIASVASLFMAKSIDFDASANSPTYSFGPLGNTKTQMLPIPIIYGGPIRVAGNVCYEKYIDAEKTTMHRYIGISEGPIHSIEQVFANEFDLAGTELEGCSYNAYLNTNAQSTDSRNPSGKRPYPNDFAFIACTLKAQEKLSSSPTITSIVHGRIIWTPQGTKFSTNPIWIIRDFLTNTRYGLGIPTAKIDAVSFQSSASYCDELVGGKPRFSLTYVVDTQKPAVDILTEMLTCVRGYMLCRDKICIYIDQPVATYYKAIGMDSIIENSFSWWQSAEEDRLNRVLIEWVDPDNSYELTTTIFDDVADQNKRGINERSFSLRGITNSQQAGRMGAYLLDGTIGVINFCSFSLALQDADVEAGDVIALTHDLAGWNKKWFRVNAITDNDSIDDAITVVCSEYVAEIYDDRALNIPPRIQTELDNPVTVPNVKNVNIVEDGYKLRDGTHVGSVWVSWQKVDSASRYQVFYSYDGGAETYWQDVSKLDNPTTEITGVRIGHTIKVRVVAVNSLGMKSTGTESKPMYLVGIDLAPPNLEQFKVYQKDEDLVIMCDTPTYRDYNRVEIRIGGNSWKTAKHFQIGRTFPHIIEAPLWNGTYSFWAKGVDNGNNYSVDASMSICTIKDMDIYKNVVLQRNDIDDTTGIITDGLYLSPEGYYVATSKLRYMDVADVYGGLTRTTFGKDQPYISLTSAVIDTHKVGLTGIIYDFEWNVFFGGDATFFDLGDRTFGEYPTDTFNTISLLVVEVIKLRFSDDNLTWTDWLPYSTGDYDFRYVQYSLRLDFPEKAGFVKITKLQQYYDVPDIEIVDSISVSNTGKVINYISDYGRDFYATPTQITATILNGDGNVFPDVTNLDETGMTITCYNRTGTKVAGDIKLIIKGY